MVPYNVRSFEESSHHRKHKMHGRHSMVMPSGLTADSETAHVPDEYASECTSTSKKKKKSKTSHSPRATPEEDQHITDRMEKVSCKSREKSDDQFRLPDEKRGVSKKKRKLISAETECELHDDVKLKKRKRDDSAAKLHHSDATLESSECNKNVGMESNQTHSSDNDEHGKGKSLDASHRMLERMSAILKQSPNTEDYKKTLVNFDWQKVCFDQYGPADCKKFWYSVHRQLRKYRTLAELVDEALALKTVKRFYKTVDPMKPKQPVTPLFLFYRKKRAKYLRKYPTVRPSELSKIMAAKYAKLSEAKKQKYIDAYRKAKEVYQNEMDKYRWLYCLAIRTSNSL